MDFKILELERLKNNIPKEIEERKASLNSAEEEYKNNETVLKETQKTIRTKEGALNDEMEHLKKTQVKLNVVKTNKEYSAVLSEIESIKKNKDKFEEEIIILLDTTELIKKKINESKKKVDNERTAWEGIVNEKGKELNSPMYINSSLKKHPDHWLSGDLFNHFGGVLKIKEYFMTPNPK